jgi:predicted DNA-binding helix-hairpin-helix protein
MDTIEKLDILAKAAEMETDTPCGLRRGEANPLARFISPVIGKGGRPVMLLKILQDNACLFNCGYCGLHASADNPHVSFAPEELAGLFIDLTHKKLVSGLFLSSGIAGSPNRAMQRMLDTVEIVRQGYQFTGYIHLKIMPGCGFDYVEQAVRLADRVSVNLEAPSAPRLAKIADQKMFQSAILQPMYWVKQLADRGLAAPSGMVTQYVVGAAGEPDSELLTTTQSLYREINLRRAHYSAFSPVPGTPLQELPPTSPRREHRLYQADFLMRQYGFDAGELVYRSDGNLPTGGDPKLLWARYHPERYPIEVNTASRDDLLRIPGIGPQSAERIMTMRRNHHRLRSLADLKAIGAVAERSAPFVLLDGHRIARDLPPPRPVDDDEDQPVAMQLKLPLWQATGCSVT